jgi:phage protein D
MHNQGENGMNFSAIEKKHKGFEVPQFSIKVGGSPVKLDEFPVIDLNVYMSAGFDMGSCEFTIAGIFDQKNGKFDPDVYSKFKPGKVVDVKVGYSSTTGVFKGYINALAFSFQNNMGPYVTVQCLDAKGALVNNRTWKNYGKQDIKSIVASILQEKCSKYATISKVDSDFDEGETGAYDESPEIKDNIDDYQYVIEFAKKTNNSFCVIYDKLYFCENLARKARTMVELEWGKSLMSFSSEVNLSGQVGKVIVYGIDNITQKAFSAQANSVPGKGESGADMASVVKSKTMTILDSDVANQSQATELAKHTLESYALQLVKCKGTTIGMPEIIAGDKIGISGMGKGVDGEYYLTHVTHRINGRGYITGFEGISSHVR